MDALRECLMLKKRLLWFTLMLMVWLCALPFQDVLVYAQNETEAPENADEVRLVYVIPIHQTIETGLERFLRRAFDEAQEAGADVIVLEITTLGGAVDAAAQIGQMIRLSPIHTVAFVKGRAISAGSYIALNADEIYMDRGSSIGAAAIVDLTGEPVQDPKTLSYWVSEMRSAAQASGRNPDYAEGMVVVDKVVHVEELNKTYGPNELITFTAQEAVQAGYAEGLADSLNEVLAHIGAQNAVVERVELTPAEKLARFLTHPVVMTLLLLAGLAGIGIELFVPGFGLPGIVGITALVAYFLGQYVAGFAGIEHILLFLAGVVLLIIEIFVPSFGIFIILGIVSLSAGIVLAAYDTGNAVRSLLIALFCAIVTIVIVSKIFQKRGVWNKFILRDQFTTEHGYIPTKPREDLLGKTGKAVTPLRPSGTAMIEDERVDVVTAGEFIPAGKQVVVSKVEGNRIVVKEISLDEQEG